MFLNFKNTILLSILAFFLISCSNKTISNSYHSSMEKTKNITIKLEIDTINEDLTLLEKKIDLSTINSTKEEITKIYESNKNNHSFIESLNRFIYLKLDNIGFNQNIDYIHTQGSSDNNLLFTKKATKQTPNNKTILLCTPYYNSTHEFSPLNISIVLEILKLYEHFESIYDISILFINNSSNINNNINYSINEIIETENLNIMYVLDINFENSLNKVSLMSLNKDSTLSKYVSDSIKYNSFNFINNLSVNNEDNYTNLKKSNIDYIKIVSETTNNYINKSCNFIISILCDMLNNPPDLDISLNNSILKINLLLDNYNSLKYILYKHNDNDFIPLIDKSSITVKENSILTFKVVDLFENESPEFSIKLN